MSTKLAAATNDSVKPKIKKIGPMPKTDQYLHDRPDNNQQINVNQSCYKKKDKKAECPPNCDTNDQHKACSKCGLCSPQCTCNKDPSKCDANEQQCANSCGNKESCGNSPSAGCDNKQQNNINMNKQQDDMALVREEPLTTSRCDQLKQPTIGSTEQLGETGGTPVNNQQTHREHGSARNTLTRVKSQLKRLLNHKPVKIKVFEPSGETNTNVNKAATNMHLFFNDKSEATCKVVIKRQNFPSDLKKEMDNSKTDTLMDDGPSDVEDNTKNINQEVTKSKSTEENSKPSKSEISKAVNSSLKKVNCLPGERSSSTEIKHQEEEIREQSVSNTSPENRRALPKQRTFIIEKPKMAWSSPVMRSKCERNDSGSPVRGIQSGSSPLVATDVKSLHSNSRATFDIGPTETKDIGAWSTHVTSTSSNKLLRVEKHSETYLRPQMQSYSDPVIEDSNVCSADAEEVGNEVIASDDGGESSGNDKDEANTSQHKINDSLAWVIVSDDKSSSAQVEKDTSASSNVQSSDIRQPVSANQHPPRTNQKKSKLLKFTKTFANLPNNITGNILNMFPSSSRLNRPKYGNSKGDKPNFVDRPTATATHPQQPEPEGDSSLLYEAVLMKHASTLTRSKKHTHDAERFSDSLQK
ncbi:uncharacterized protein LOC106071180 [Biomphalaria glabrata]|uniref:Uncharacterized protein LOC106071180 n=1 Tax=Biomphalaria glabrata TaxID=6526 RepID=A0A9W3AA42_BIOGL|nr:uncharacterized protein LOC106071180 [Biomphalaria glabrata]XP_055884026.1 uncharacterized protein LOC106071180 [Biomphalaria glabrata]